MQRCSIIITGPDQQLAQVYVLDLMHGKSERADSTMSKYDKACQVWLCFSVQLMVTSVRAVCVCRAGRLQAKFVIHTVGPVYESKEASAPLLRKAYTYVPCM